MDANVAKLNSITELHELLKQVVGDEIRRLPETLEQMKPNERANVLLKLLPYVAPKIEGDNNPYDTWGTLGA